MGNQPGKAPTPVFFKVPYGDAQALLRGTVAALNHSRKQLYLTSANVSEPTVFVGRVDLDGNPDRAFGPGQEGWTDQALEMGQSQPYTPAGLVSRDNGGVIAGLINDDHLGLVGFQGDGSLDPAFGTGGKIVHAVPVGRSSIPDSGVNQEFHPQINGSAGVLAAAGGGAFFGLAGGRFASAGTLLRMTSDGQLDRAFGTDGKVTVKYGSESTSPVAVVAASVGAVVIVGTIRSTDGYKLFLVRYSANGSLDQSFGDKGFVLFQWSDMGIPGAASQMELTGVVAHHDGGFFGIGYANSESLATAIVVRVDAFGKPVMAFNGGKPKHFRVKSPEGEELNTDLLYGGTSVQFDGRLVVGGGVSIRSSGYQRETLLAVITKEGNLDTSFTDTGWLTFKPLDYPVSVMSNLLVVTDPDVDVIYAAGDPGEGSQPSDQGFVTKISVPVLGKNGGK